jgi:hypothetical protein
LHDPHLGSAAVVFLRVASVEVKVFPLLRGLGDGRELEPIENPKIESTVRYLGVDVEDALPVSGDADRVLVTQNTGFPAPCG